MGQVPRLGGPPSRQLFRPPTGILKAKSFKKRCLQATLTQDSTYGNEDCLYLNIWVPQGGKEGLFSPLRPPAPQTARGLAPAPGLCLGAPELNFLTSAQIGWGGGDGQDMGGVWACIWHHGACSPPPQSPTPCPS